MVKSGALCGCITAIPAQTSIYKTAVPMVEINFLCVHKKLRANRLAPVLISEITRRFVHIGAILFLVKVFLI